MYEILSWWGSESMQAKQAHFPCPPIFLCDPLLNLVKIINTLLALGLPEVDAIFQLQFGECQAKGYIKILKPLKTDTLSRIMDYTFYSTDVTEWEFLLRLYLATIIETILQTTPLPRK